MVQHRYWVIGGDYTCLAFKALRRGGDPQVAGPFETKAEARDVWKRLSGEHSSRATVRFSIASEELFIPN
jgi:hypothetical protein